MESGLARRQRQTNTSFSRKMVQKARSLHRVPPEERFVISELKKVRGLPWNGRAANLKATIVTQQDQAPSGHRRVYLTTRVVARHGRLAAVAVSVWDHTQKHVECDWKRHWPTRGQILSKRRLDQLLSLLPSPMNQHRRHSRSHRLHHRVLLRRCQRKNLKNEQMDSPVELGPQKRRERKGARPSETPTSEI